MKTFSPKPVKFPVLLTTIKKQFLLTLQGQELVLTPEEAESLYEALKDALSL